MRLLVTTWRVKKVLVYAPGLPYKQCIFLTSPSLSTASFPSAGRAWLASELRLKSFDDLHRLWFICLKERNMLLTERLYYKQVGQAQPDPHRLEVRPLIACSASSVRELPLCARSVSYPSFSLPSVSTSPPSSACRK